MYVHRLLTRGVPRHSTDSLSTFQSSNDVPPIPCMHTRNACVRVRVRSCLSFFSLSFFLFFFPAPFHPQARDPPREGTFFLTGGGPQRRRFFYFTPPLSHSTPSTVFPPLSLSRLFLSPLFFLFFSLSLFFLQVHPLSPVPLSHRCPIHPPQTRVATCSTLFHLIRGHKLLPRSLYTVEKKEKRERERGKASRSINYFFSFFPFFSLLQPLFAPCLSRFFRAGTLHGVKS